MEENCCPTGDQQLRKSITEIEKIVAELTIQKYNLPTASGTKSGELEDKHVREFE